MEYAKSFRIVVFGFAMAFLFMTSAPVAFAEAWGTNAASAILKEVLERTQRAIDGVLLASTKTAATSVLNSQVAALVGGSNLGETGFITDWEEYLYQEPLEETRVYMDSYLTAVTGGRASSNYQSAGVSGSSYSSYLKQYAEGMLVSTSDGTIMAASAEEEIPNFQEELASGNIEAINVYFQDNNNPFIVAMNAQEQERAMYEALQNVQEQKAESYDGFRGVTAADGKTITTPGSTVKDVVSDIYGIGPNIIATSDNPAELTSGVVLAVVNSALTDLFEQGLGSVRTNIEREVTSVSSQIDNQLRSLTGVSNTLEQFTTEVRQQTGISSGAAADGSAAVPISI